MLQKQQPVVYGTFIFGKYAAGCVSELMGLVTLTFDLLTLKLMWEWHLRWGTFVQNLGTLGFWVLELFAMYATDGQKQRLLPLRYGRGHNNGRTNERTDEWTGKRHKEIS